MKRLYKKCKEDVIPKLRKDFDIKNILAVPNLEKVVINVGLGKNLTDKDFIITVQKNLEKITGQKPVLMKAKKSISNFKIRKGMTVGMKVTLRNKRMYDFLDKLINVTFPRVRDFRGIEPKKVDGAGNITIGFKEYSCFPEIELDDIGKSHGLEVSIVINSRNSKESIEFLTEMGFPFKKS
ncbi:50S ribosomal protein L5 [Patescibacteria group bacterium]